MNTTVRLPLLILSFCCLIAQGVFAEETPAVSPESLRNTIAKSLPYLETAGVAWIEEKDCVSCHRVSFQSWSYNAAASRGFSETEARARTWLDWSVAKSLEPNPETEKISGETNIDGLSQLLLGHRAGTAVPMKENEQQQFVELILKTQLEDGSWVAAGQLPMQKRPKRETAEVSTMWNLLALHTAGDSTAVDAAIERAKAWIAEAKPAVSSEWHAVRLLLADMENNESVREMELEQLRSLQREDGGWGWLIDAESDALATGQALYALAAVGVDSQDPAIVRAQQYLINTQTEDGSWPVHGTKTKKKDQVEETATYWGTAWAVIALLETME
ncbi:prenyltransferase/squalene oxidase repeat-containing protein [Rubinisphaera margarita]|uniref:prenyltransferase/squalene oxidase repeat-containing protein n=1 Tax=Rubinisphaera margarita TaxID=2909586 RepID=UPI001EE7B8A5|nr:prenyltransferase/squalene oxidase repeat-containing protein [Rubinisphaera margarita]MCG6155037.1 terpene cyclase/mutase family protein [Rubinisphaera margarita]